MKALEECDGDILDAVSLLEAKGIINRTSAAYNPDKKKEKPSYSSQGVNLRKESSGTYTPPPSQNTDGTKNTAENIGERLKYLLKKSVEYSFTVYKGEKKLVSMPVMAIIALAVFAFWVTLIALAAGLIAGCRYEISADRNGS